MQPVVGLTERHRDQCKWKGNVSSQLFFIADNNRTILMPNLVRV